MFRFIYDEWNVYFLKFQVIMESIEVPTKYILLNTDKQNMLYDISLNE